MKNLTLKLPVAALFLVICLSISGCTAPGQPGTDKNKNGNPPPVEKPFAEENRLLAGLLPAREGYTWYYYGFAEYGHRMTLKTIEKGEGSYNYIVEGVVDDPSGGEAPDRDYNLNITYKIGNGVLTQVKKESMMLDSEYDRLELIRTPLEKGSKWTQKVISGEDIASLECEIEDVKEVDNAKVYKVTYRKQGSDYYEIREIKEGVGVISFEKLLVLEDQSFPAGYNMNEEASGYK